MIAPTLLIVDDDRGNCAVIVKMLVRQGYQIDEAFDGRSALECLDEKAYDLAVLDYQMPGMSGVELFNAMTNRQPGIVGIFLTGFAGFSKKHPEIVARGTVVLQKPVDFDELLPIIEELVGKPRD